MPDSFPNSSPSPASQDPVNPSSYLIHSFEHRAYPLDQQQSFTIGRHSTSDIIINEVAVSRKHADIRSENGKFVLHPLGKTPTRVNGSILHSPYTLRAGDTITIGTMRFVFAEEPLPVAITIASYQRRPVTPDDVSDIRNTLTYPVQNVPPYQGSKRPVWLWVFLAVAIVLVLYVALQFFLTPS